jgi:membrane protein implicated in regulation of membrane protease activity
MPRRGTLEGAGWVAVLALVACCGLTGLFAAGVAVVVLWSVGLGLVGAVVATAALAWFLGRARSRNRKQRKADVRRNPR